MLFGMIPKSGSEERSSVDTRVWEVMAMESIIKEIVSDGGTFWIIGGAIAIIAILSGVIGGTIKSVARERTRREIAAYIAEGSMTPEQGEKLMKASPKDSCE